jgi:predicted RNA-binding Zn-ribbon protein involved in translation (DUF1610 family)
MGRPEDKFKSSKRRHKDRVKTKKQVDIAKSCGIIVDAPHRFAKKHATNCGNSNCVLCGNPRKFFGEKTLQEKRAEQE